MWIHVNWPAFWLRFAVGALLGFLAGLYHASEGTVGWHWTFIAAASTGLLVALFASEPCRRLFHALMRGG